MWSSFSNYYVSFVDDDQSSVSALILKGGYLDATISTLSETYYVEPAGRYSHIRKENDSFPAVIYKASDVLYPEVEGGGCASHEMHLKRFERHFEGCRHSLNQSSSSVIPDGDDECPRGRTVSGLFSAPPSHGGRGKKLGQPQVPDIAQQAIDKTLYSGWDRHKEKSKRRRSINRRKVTCMLYLQADHLFYKNMGSEEACIETMTRHVQRVNTIYKNIGRSNYEGTYRASNIINFFLKLDFDGDGVPDEINFMIKRIKVHTDQALNDPSYRFPGNYGVEKFLELFSGKELAT